MTEHQALAHIPLRDADRPRSSPNTPGIAWTPSATRPTQRAQPGRELRNSDLTPNTNEEH